MEIALPLRINMHLANQSKHETRTGNKDTISSGALFTTCFDPNPSYFSYSASRGGGQCYFREWK